MAEPASLTGVWQGLYSYDDGEAVSFVAVLLHSGPRLSGSVHEPDGFGHSSCGLLYANIDGQCLGSRVSFIKTYDGNSGILDPIAYDGELSGDGCEISGGWLIPGDISGRFLMTRPRRQASKAGLRATVTAHG
jgi:hypothetical protein